MPGPTFTETDDARTKIFVTGQRLMAAKGFSAVGLTEILATAGVPKGSFYHYFRSKDAFGEAMLEHYFEAYLAELDETLALPGMNTAGRLMRYFEGWQETQSLFDCQGRCLAVKLGAEVADLSESMRLALMRGTAAITARLSKAIAAGIVDGSISVTDDPDSLANSLYQLWLGASVMVKIVRGRQPFDIAMTATREMLQLSP